MTDKQNESAIPPDPILQKSYSTHIALASVALVGAVAYAIVDEIWMRRPYKPIQNDYREATLAYLSKVEAERLTYDAALRELDEYKALDAEVARVEQANAEAVAKVRAEFGDLAAEVDVLKELVKPFRSEINALTYNAEVEAHHAGDHDAASSEAAKPYLAKIAEIESKPLTYEYVRTNGETVKGSGTVRELVARFISLQGAKGIKQTEVGEALAPVGAAAKARDAWLAQKLGSIGQFLATAGDAEKSAVGAKATEIGLQRYLDEHAVPLAPSVVAKVREQVEGMATDPFRGGEIQRFQIHVKDAANWVDRCQVCHLGALSVVPVTKESLEAAVQPLNWSEKRREQLSLYASHPRAAEIFAKHDPEKVPCSTCHNGNGVAITTVELAHGENHHWNWPLFGREHMEAGCLQCHQKDIHLPGGPRITEARKSFLDKGCWGCHPYEGHDRATSEISKLESQVGDMERRRTSLETRRQSFRDASSVIEDGPAGERVLAASSAEQARITEEIALVDTEIQVASRRIASLHGERERVGPNLKDLVVAMHPEVITPWIQDPTSVRASTKMPVFRWWGAVGADGLNEEAKDIAAFLVQSALSPEKFPEYRLPAPAGGNAGRGRELIQKVGCVGACHSIVIDGKKLGADFAAELTNVGDKKTHAWILRWIRDPQHRIVPYSVTKKRDLTEAEAAKEDPATIVRRQPTRMPSLRLSDEESNDIAAFLAGQRSDRKWPEPTWLRETERFERGKQLVVYSGCAGCHEIAGLESERGIGTDLTKEGSKPLDRLDFGHHTTAAKRGEIPVPGMDEWKASDGEQPFKDMYGTHHGWYRPRGYFMHKLADPAIYDTAKLFTDRFLRSRMPKFRLSGEELHDLTTFLLGSQESLLPKSAMYNPDEAGAAVREGWWILRKYNCQGCHQVETSDRPSLWGMFTPEEVAEARDRLMPPTLVGEGFRVRPDWLAEFLHDPSLGGGTKAPRAVRRHLESRMPTYSFTEDEAAALVRFFGAMAKQPGVYQPPKLAPLSKAEIAAAEAIASADGANCFLCHLRGDQAVSTETKAPHLGYPARLRPEWMARWIPEPTRMQPWSKMLMNFHRENDDPKGRWVSNQDATLPAANAVKGDHVDLMIRWIRAGMPSAK